MKIPVTGFVMDFRDEDGHHSHKLYITSWNGAPVHVHQFSGVTSVDVGHSHHYAGWTAPARSGIPHVHGYYSVTSLDKGHTHVIQGTTGAAIGLPGGGHYHSFEGHTTVNGSPPHSHTYSGRTGNAVNAT
ncbi:YmaF family protein [Paenibacillus sp. GCM10027626]|uniref:YmaF family protein n=1 Tax=Paenibacillus sp. GCM10027626 TaxID=3273411 RepID=UPI0036278B8E